MTYVNVYSNYTHSVLDIFLAVCIILLLTTYRKIDFLFSKATIHVWDDIIWVLVSESNKKKTGSLFVCLCV